MNQSSPASLPTAEQDVSLIDLLLILIRSWRLIATCTVLVAGLAGGLAALQPRTYTYQTTIEIGRSGEEPLESADAVVVKLRSAYMPAVVQAKGTSEAHMLGLEISSPKGSNLVIMSSQGSMADEQSHREFHNEIFNRLAADHGRKLQRLRNALEIEELNVKRSLTALDERFTRAIPDEQSSRSKDQADIQRRVQGIEETASQLHLRIATIEETRKVVETQRSVRPNGFGPVTIGILAAVAGAFLGIVVALLRAALQARGLLAAQV